MHLFPFLRMFPERDSSECRVIHVVNQPDLPDGAYALMESYCTDPDCDCRRVMLNVFNPEISSAYLASISYGFDREEEYAGPFLDPLNPQSKYARALFPLVKMVLAYPAYVARLESHYRKVKRALADPTHKIHSILLDARRTSRQRTKKIGRNAPCPCGSGKKYKKCCLEKDMLKEREPLQEAGLSPTAGEGLSTEEMPELDPEITLGDLFDIKSTEIKDDETKGLLLYHIRTGNCPYNKKECIPRNCPLGEEGIKQCTFH